jgi:hypothetical protein
MIEIDCSPTVGAGKLPLLPWDCRSTALIFAAALSHHFYTAAVKNRSSAPYI